MQIAILSGKGGAGKTLVAVNLVNLINLSTYIDCDVEEPNGKLYFSSEYNKKDINVLVPKINYKKCTHCNKCVDFCRYNALIDFLGKVKLLPSLCHSCGGCKLVCEFDAITEVKEPIGYIYQGDYKYHQIYGGELKIGKESGIEIISQLISKADKEKINIIDCPPGNGCSVMESIEQADYCILVSEPTIFGLENLKLVHELTTLYNKNIGLIINKANDYNNIIEDFAKTKDISIIGYIPFDKELAKLNSNQQLVSDNNKFKPYFIKIIEQIKQEVDL
ncbi:MAG: 4Fe-4S binding protein [Candidatus Izimaplasma sp.]|nr:4Fe-4S binding protein [Candidatus Izimaplasma bacterium]